MIIFKWLWEIINRFMNIFLASFYNVTVKLAYYGWYLISKDSASFYKL